MLIVLIPGAFSVLIAKFEQCNRASETWDGLEPRTGRELREQVANRQPWIPEEHPPPAPQAGRFPLRSGKFYGPVQRPSAAPLLPVPSGWRRWQGESHPESPPNGALCLAVEKCSGVCCRLNTENWSFFALKNTEVFSGGCWNLRKEGRWSQRDLGS